MDKKRRSLAIAAVIAFSIITFVKSSISEASQAKFVASADTVQPFVGVWAASIDGTRIIDLALRADKSGLTGMIRVCGFSIDTEGTGKLGLVTNEKMSPELPLRNLRVSGRSVSFDWKDPDGDENNWRLELLGKDAGRLIWVSLPSGLKAEPIPVNRISE